LRHESTHLDNRSGPFSLWDDSRDGGGKTKFGTRVVKVRMRGYIKQRVINCLSLTSILPLRERGLTGQQ